MNKFVATGTVKGITPKTTVESTGEPAQEFFIDAEGQQYGGVWKFRLYGTDKVAQLGGVKVGDRIEVNFDINGRTYDKKDGSGKGHFQDLSAWKVTRVQDEPTAADVTVPGEDDSLPF